MPNFLAAHLTALFVAAAARRDERGQTTAEYIGIMVVIVAIIGTILGLQTNIMTGAQGVVDEVFKTLKSKVS